MSNEHSLYADWKKLYPRYQTGFFRRLRWIIVWILLGTYYVLPFIRWQRPGTMPNQAVLFDLPARKFYLFDLIVWPQEIFLLTFLLMAAAFGLFFITALAGRVFCGYMCFQTVWTDMFLYVEKLVEGNRKKRIKLDTSGWTVEKIAKKLIKHTLWIIIGLITGGVFVFYFVDAPTLMGEFLLGEAPFAAWFTLGFLTLGTYIFAGIAREQVCIFMCPYARIQGVMFDEDTIVVAYNPELGEPRESNKRVRNEKQEKGEPVGVCIDCNECVTVCPTGIDIRNGQQYECITCGSCIDACNSVKDRLHLKNSLIRYISLRENSGGKPQLFRFRLVIYGGLFLLILAGITGYFVMRSPVGLNVLRHRKPVYIQQADGSIQNNFTIRVLNMSPAIQHYTLSVSGLKDTALTVAAVSETDAQGNPLLKVISGEAEPFTAYLRQSRTALGKGPADIVFHLTAQDPKGGSDHYESVFMRPNP